MTTFVKQIGNVRGTVTEETVDGKPSRHATFTRRQADGSDSHTFSDEGDLAQLSMVVWRVEEYQWVRSFAREASTYDVGRLIVPAMIA